ncbi:1-phosphofructokinase [Clostridiaceae bacterium M8S5]|nr:1-phosphofructokinase [Clostridiaceae bacterium M8S5]
MITTITLNASIDRNYVLDEFTVDKIFRCEDFSVVPGGKGINVSKVLSQLGEKVCCLGFIGGYTGTFIKKELEKQDITTKFTTIDEESRTCISIVSSDGSQTEILERGPKVNERELESFLSTYDKILDKSSIVVASGSIAQGINTEIYYDLINKAKNKGVKFILDTSSKYLIKGIKAKPYLIKPNKEELEDITATIINNEYDIIKASNKLIEMGADNVAVSLGKEGMMYINREYTYKVIIPKAEVINPVGSGDSTVAGFVYALANNYNIENSLKLANACGISNAMNKETGKINSKVVETLIGKIKVERYKNNSGREINEISDF